MVMLHGLYVCTLADKDDSIHEGKETDSNQRGPDANYSKMFPRNPDENMGGG